MKFLKLGKKSRWVSSKKWRIILSVLLGIIFTETLILAFWEDSPLPKAPLQTYADQVLGKCSSSSYKPSCYDEEIPKLMEILSMEEAFQVTALVQSQDRSYSYCHVLGHELSAREAAKDLSKWKDVIGRCPPGVCANGCLHGAFQERFRAENATKEQLPGIVDELQDACEKKSNWNPTGLEQATCYHGLGHLAMYITSADIETSLSVCDQVSVKGDGRNFSEVCYEGLFMQLFQPLDPEDEALVKGISPSKENLRTFCQRFGPVEKVEACWNEGWPLFAEEVKSPMGLVAFCSTPPQPRQHKCYEMLFAIRAQGANFDIKVMTDFCAGLPKDRQGHCFSNSASSIIAAETSRGDESAKVCVAAIDLEVAKQCYEGLVAQSTYNLRAGSNEFLKLCNSLPAPWKESCLSKG